MPKAYRYLPAIVMAIGIGSATSACATQTYGYRGGYRQDIQRRAYDNGYREGLNSGREDARRGREFSYTRNSEYRSADRGYRRDEGDRDFYRQLFRQGFQAGYTEGFNQNARARAVPRTGPFGGIVTPGISQSQAAQIGYRDGLDEGRNDARNRRSFDPVGSKRYRAADHDYDRRYGAKDQFQREYRAAFQQGYADGYRGSRG